MRKKPMLAYPVSDKPINYDDKVFMQPKLDGVRCVIQYDNSTVTAYSRTGKEWKNIDHILFNLKPWFALNPDVILDGELYNHDLKDDFEKIISLVRKTKPTDEDRFEAGNLVQYHVYDTIAEGINYEDRYNWLRINLPIYKTMTLIANTIVSSYTEAKMLHDVHLAQS